MPKGYLSLDSSKARPGTQIYALVVYFRSDPREQETGEANIRQDGKSIKDVYRVGPSMGH